MSLHNKPDYHIPELIEALKAHRLPHDTPSQLADSFRIGWMACCRELAQADSVQEDAARYRWLREGNDAKHGAAWYVAVNLYGGEWDAAIDAAMNKGGAT